jgi:hypothetical protein
MTEYVLRREGWPGPGHPSWITQSRPALPRCQVSPVEGNDRALELVGGPFDKALANTAVQSAN